MFFLNLHILFRIPIIRQFFYSYMVLDIQSTSNQEPVTYIHQTIASQPIDIQSRASHIYSPTNRKSANRHPIKSHCSHIYSPTNLRIPTEQSQVSQETGNKDSNRLETAKQLSDNQLRTSVPSSQGGRSHVVSLENVSARMRSR